MYANCNITIDYTLNCLELLECSISGEVGPQWGYFSCNAYQIYFSPWLLGNLCFDIPVEV